jgi:hypothetical protein
LALVVLAPAPEAAVLLHGTPVAPGHARAAADFEAFYAVKQQEKLGAPPVLGRRPLRPTQLGAGYATTFRQPTVPRRSTAGYHWHITPKAKAAMM